MMRLLRSWRDSLLLLAPQNFKLFALVTLKSTFETYKVLARVWYLWLWTVGVLIYVFTNRSYPYRHFPLEFYLSFVTVLFTIIVCLATRPSIGQKHIDYFKSYMRSFFIWLASFFMFIFVVSMLEQQFDYFIFMSDFLPLWIFFLLFFLDSDGSIKQLWYAVVRAVKMTIYNLPLLFVSMAFLWVATVIAVRSFVLIIHYLASAWFATYTLEVVALLLFYACLFKPLLINIWTNIYIKKLHEMPDLYFKQPK